MIRKRNVLICDKCHYNVAYLVPILTSIPMSPEMDLCYRCLSKAIAEERMSVAEEIAYADAISKEQLDLDKP